LLEDSASSAVRVEAEPQPSSYGLEAEKAESSGVRLGDNNDGEIILKMTRAEVIDIWMTEGKPVIHVGPGENCLDLEKLLSRPDVSEKHLLAVRRWLDTVEAKP